MLFSTRKEGGSLNLAMEMYQAHRAGKTQKREKIHKAPSQGYTSNISSWERRESFGRAGCRLGRSSRNGALGSLHPDWFRLFNDAAVFESPMSL